ncbi:unnamed protein product [Didymodactylos carnosus]|uniref:C2H2-type domain-containing protein n=1 Tax=Didymodactylos carnosus TaxID=1234261 RepID=A0A815I3L6_9BILA|nr:unnamed protein product [Didymodactylos carnosus]CAF1360766.1 unnamed protein product [Didymodactylos carnosus]CAF3835255.1 unnamed protein product [Didymodactylos carnosus]CAF4238833.1 unnamed protein product [Didymodactylos carnosus]
MSTCEVHCLRCNIPFKTMTSYIEHNTNVHNSGRDGVLQCSCKATFKNLRSLQKHWCVYHKDEHNVNQNEPMPQFDGDEEEAEQDMVDLDPVWQMNHDGNTQQQQDPSEILKKRVLHLLLTLQSQYHTSEAAVQFVADSLSELFNLKNYLLLPEVHADLHRQLPPYDPNYIKDVYDGKFGRNHPQFNQSTYLKIELNSDDLTVTNSISHRASSLFFFYWSLLNLSREKRAKHNAKRLIAACPKWARTYDSLHYTLQGFLADMKILSTIEIKSDTWLTLKNFICWHNGLFKWLYPGEAKPKFRFMTHFPQPMRKFGPLPYTSCLATERKHQYFKGNKVRNLKNPALMLAHRHQIWACIVDHNQDGSYSHTALSLPPQAKMDAKQPIDDGQIQYIIQHCGLPFEPTAVLKSIELKGITYEKYSILNVSNEYFPKTPQFGKISKIFWDGTNCGLYCQLFDIKDYCQQLRFFEVKQNNNFKLFSYNELRYKRTLKLVSSNFRIKL